MMASSEAEIPSEPASESSAAMDAKAKREARKARILSSGTDRLARITKTGRGSEADLLYNESPKGTRVGPYPAQTVDLDTSISQDDERMLKRTQVAMQGGVLPSSDDDPGEIDIGQQQRIDASNSAGSNPFMMGGQQQEGMPQDLAGMMQMMQKAMMGGGGGPPGPNGQGIDTQQGGVPFSFPFGPPGPAETSTPPASRKFDVLESAFNFLRILVFVVFGLALVYGALSGRASATSFVPEDENSAIVEKFAHMTTLDRWARLAYERPAHWEARYFGVESFGLPIHGIPVFWLFITLEIALQSSRIMLHRSKPTPPGFLLKAVAYIPNAHIRLLIRTLASYLPLLDGFVNDLAIVVFTIGCTIIFAAWKTGLDPALSTGLQDLSASAATVISEKVMEMNDPVMQAAM